MPEITEVMEEKDLEIDQLMKKFESSFKDLDSEIAETKKKYFKNFLQQLKPEEKQRVGEMTWMEIHHNFCRNRSKKIHIVALRLLSGEEKKTLVPFVKACKCGFIFII
ncbi:MAG: hypothetical protein IB617_03425 [Candidatus Nealsonbacteria bacterium]|nr:MAG: hypothetical protein IB617_03425 [Candidatus Nealsonbacteria bacterium]